MYPSIYHITTTYLYKNRKKERVIDRFEPVEAAHDEPFVCVAGHLVLHPPPRRHQVQEVNRGMSNRWMDRWMDG